MVAWSFGLLVGVVVLGFLIVTLLYPFEYVRRIIVWGPSDLHDYLNNFPMRRLEPAPTPFFFDERADEARVARLFETVLEVDDFETFLADNETLAFIVIQNDTILYEKYFNGTQRESLVTSFSVAKSFTSALIGVAIAEGHIHSVDDPITDYLPELAERDPSFKNITIRHLLMMASGLDYQAFRPGLFNSDDILTSYYPDQRQAALEFTQIIDSPGAYLRYNKYHPQLLGLILERTTHRSVTDYMQEKLWDPLGMEFDGSWSLDSETSGFEKMEAGLNARAIDFAKFGRLYLEKGNWNGQQVIPAAWIEESTRIDRSIHQASYYQDEFGQHLFKDGTGYYKYMWYGFIRSQAQYDFAAAGDHGQFIYIAPHKNLIIVRNGETYGLPWSEWFKLFYQVATDF
jgi:CubicO group peptidase (beta-lactamase class C family)